MVHQETGIGEAGLERLRHDLLNSLNVLVGTTAVLLETELTDVQHSCVTACRSAAQRMLGVIEHLEQYQQTTSLNGPAQLADLCSIAVGRMDKPFDREALLAVIRRLAPMPAARILVVDDAPDIGVLVRAFLKDTDSVVDVVADGERAVSQASSQQYDLVLMDIDLPGLDGATAAHAIRAADLARGAKPTPVVAMSAVGSRIGAPGAQPAEPEVIVLEDPETAPLVPDFLQNRRDEIPALRAALERSDFGRIQAVGHKMKGTGSGYGFETISRIGADIELAAHSNKAVALEQLIDELDRYLSHVRTVTK